MRRRLSIRREAWPTRGAFTIARGSRTEVHVLVVEIAQDGAVGRGECVPYRRYGESLDSVTAQIESVERALTAGHARHEHWCTANNYLLRGDIALAQHRPDEAEGFYRRGMDFAARQSALLYRLRAATRLARLTAAAGITTAYHAISFGQESRAEPERLARGIGTIAASQYPNAVIVRLSDFKTNEYANLIGGQAFEPTEENPMLGWRGASRYYSDDYRAGFALECAAIKRVRETMGFRNVVVMVPFCRTPAEADRVLEVMAENGLKRGENGLEVYVMAEIPSNIIQADEFAERFDGFSVGSNDLTQLVLGVGRDAERLADLFDERNPSVKRMITDLIERAHAADRPVGICGQAPSDHPDFAEFLVAAGIDSISVIPDSVADVIKHVAAAEEGVVKGDA